MEEQIKEILITGLQEIQEDSKKEFEGINARLKDIEENQEEVAEAVEEAGVSKKTARAFGRAIKGLFVQMKGGVPAGMKANEYTLVGTGESAEPIVGEEVGKGFLRIAEDNGVVLSKARIVKSSSQTYRMVVDNTASDFGAFADENTIIESGKLSFGNAKLVAKKWKKNIAVSEEAIKFSEPENLGNYILAKLAESFGMFIDDYAFGKLIANTSVPTVAVTGTEFTGITYDDLVDITSAVPDAVDSDSIWVGSKSVLGIIRKLKDTTGRPLIDNSVSTQLISTYTGNGKAPRAELLNYPFFTTVGMPKATDSGTDKSFLWLGSLKEALAILLSDGLVVESDKNIKSGIIDYVGTQYADADVALPGAGVLAKTS